jgi:large subunit ribosomal protein L6
MSKIGKKPIDLPENIKVEISEGVVRISDGKNNEISVPILRGIVVEKEENKIKVSLSPGKKDKQTRSNWGTQRAILQNAVLGLIKPFQKTLILEGIGYKVNKENDVLVLYLGYSHPIKYPIPPGINIEVEKNSILRISGSDKFLVGKVAAELKSLKKPEPYKGKGFRYENEVIKIRKSSKKAAGEAA